LTKQPAHDVLTVAARAGGFGIFHDLAQRAGLAEALKSGARYTMFAPTDDAFTSLPAETLDRLMQPEQAAALKAMVMGHVVAGQMLSQRLAGKRIRGKSMQGGELVLKGADVISVNDATIVRPDIMAANGVIHGIDKVLWAPQRKRQAAPIS